MAAFAGFYDDVVVADFVYEVFVAYKEGKITNSVIGFAATHLDNYFKRSQWRKAKKKADRYLSTTAEDDTKGEDGLLSTDFEGQILATSDRLHSRKQKESLEHQQENAATLLEALEFLPEDQRRAAELFCETDADGQDCRDRVNGWDKVAADKGITRDAAQKAFRRSVEKHIPKEMRERVMRHAMPKGVTA